MTFSDALKRLSKFSADNSPAILTAIGVAGTVTTAILTAKASFKAVRIIDDLDRPSRSDKVKAVWPHYIPAIGVGCISIGCIIMANGIGTRRAAGMATALTLSERAFSEYKEKVVERLGENKEREVRDEIAQDRVNKNPFNEVVIVGDGNVLCYDAYTGRYFFSSMEDLKKAQNDINYRVLNDYYASLTDFYSKIGLDRTSFSDEVGWNSDKMLELNFSATLTESGKPCIVVDFATSPIRDFYRIN